MDEISQDPKLNVDLPRGRWLDVALAAALIVVAALAVMTGRGSRPAAAPAGRPGAAATPALLPSAVTTRIRLPFGQPGGMTILGSTAWISDWSASQIIGVDLAGRRVTRTLRVGDLQDQPASMTSGAGSLWVLDFSGLLLRIDPASGAITWRFPVRGLGADVVYGDGFIWMITDEPAADGLHEHLYKIDPSRDVIVKAARIPGAGPACAAFPGPYGIWIGCAGVDRITLINMGSLTPVESVRVDSGGCTPQIVPGRKTVWVLTPSGLARADPATARITAIIRTGYAPSALSAPALVMDSAGRLWVTGSLLEVVVPETLTAYPVAPTPDLISAAADGPTIWVDTGSALVKLQADTGAPDRARKCAPAVATDSASAPSRRSKSSTTKTPATCGNWLTGCPAARGAAPNPCRQDRLAKAAEWTALPAVPCKSGRGTPAPPQLGGTMKRLPLAMLASGAVLILSPAFASQAMAATTTTSVSMTLVESVVPDIHSGCFVLEHRLCGHGQVIPYGQATETIVFGGGCGGNCDRRTITLAGGSITLEETLSNVICPGACQPNPSSPFSGTLTDVVAGGTGEFSGASGNLSGSVTAAGAVAVIKLSGAITLP